MKKVVLHYSNDSHRGPGKVVKNLSAGLRSLDLLETVGSEHDSYHGFLQFPTEAIVFEPLSRNQATVKDYLFGPNLTVLPTELPPWILKYLRNLVVPSEWVRKLYRRFESMDRTHIDVWSSGIDTDKWTPGGRVATLASTIKEPLRCLLYFKNRTQADLEFVKSLLKERGVEFRLLEYGNYTEEDLMSACSWAHFGILLTNTESQGIAYMEMLSTNLPLFVFNYPFWDYDGRYERVNATSVPYFSEACGVVTDKFDKALFEEFLGKVTEQKFSPRNYILENHTLRLSAQRYYDIMARNSQI